MRTDTKKIDKPLAAIGWLSYTRFIAADNQPKEQKMIVKHFETDHEMHSWLADPSNLDAVKKKYPPADYEGSLDLVARNVIVIRKQIPFAQQMEQTLADMEATDPMVFSNERCR